MIMVMIVMMTMMTTTVVVTVLVIDLYLKYALLTFQVQVTQSGCCGVTNFTECFTTIHSTLR
jgi:hypothetical protein